MSDNDQADDLKPLDDFHRHEVLHTASIVLDMFGDHVAEHRYTKSDPELVAEAERATEALMKFYQLVGNKTL